MNTSNGPISRWAWAEVDLDAITHNVGQLRIAAEPAEVWAVVKADGYGHGSVEVSRAALTAGAVGLCVALVSEGVVLRRAGIDAPILVLSEQPPESLAELVAHDLIATISTADGIDRLAAAVVNSGAAAHRVHLKVDTGMHRVGARPEEVPALVARIAALAPTLRLDGVFTHLAVADEPQNPYIDAQLEQFDAVLAELPNLDELAVHAVNSAATLSRPDARRTLVRPGIAVYGISPGAALDEVAATLRPALSLKARVSFVKRLVAGDRLSYGLRHTMAAPANVATVPIGYADGVRRNLSGTGATVLIDGKRREIIGTITMDQVMVDCGDDPVAVGDEVVLLGRQGDEVIRAEEWASTLGTIGYEVVCGIGPRVPRRYVSGP
ncbi:MAG TPA: alanine racemase [Desertimonas sp.]|nr:alanine racemase [Desertimonas sp.]